MSYRFIPYAYRYDLHRVQDLTPDNIAEAEALRREQDKTLRDLERMHEEEIRRKEEEFDVVVDELEDKNDAVEKRLWPHMSTRAQWEPHNEEHMQDHDEYDDSRSGRNEPRQRGPTQSGSRDFGSGTFQPSHPEGFGPQPRAHFSYGSGQVRGNYIVNCGNRSVHHVNIDRRGRETYRRSEYY